ncbi:MAG: tRNA (adenosine(37)-N6)-dimethylallyltransferase MiaA [Gammaproteobacteria bacterium]|nr:tRNA (adenosine(37)-N6)-dimethylallyltransferase MiaA [Gammaproteobacteria bacterium]
MNQQPPRTVFALMGPTASGKTELVIQLADRFNLAPISVDSAMVYRGMDIGTAKPDANVLHKCPHALINILDPEEDFSVGDFVQQADAAVVEALNLGKTPLLVGGTMLYFKRFRDGIAKLPGRDPEIRSELRQQAEDKGTRHLHSELKQVDPTTAGRIHPNNYSRIERALEVYKLSGRTMSEYLKAQPQASVSHRVRCNYIEISIANLSRPELHNRIESRVHNMLALGFVDEVKTLMQRPRLSLKAMSMRAVGYRQVWKHLTMSSDALIDTPTLDLIVAGTRQLARRQLTWLRNWQSDAQHVSVQTPDAFDVVARLLQNYDVPQRSVS